jgi:hypothetical protein
MDYHRVNGLLRGSLDNDGVFYSGDMRLVLCDIYAQVVNYIFLPKFLQVVDQVVMEIFGMRELRHLAIPLRN